MDSINCLQYKRIKRNHMIHAKYMALSFVGFGKSFYIIRYDIPLCMFIEILA